MRVRPIAFAGVHRRRAAARHFGGRNARAEAALTAEADLQSRPEARLILEARACGVGINAESAK
jgi:hypothetical protein